MKKPDKPTGRPTKLLRKETKDKILTAIRAGNYRNIAAAWAGIAAETLTRWMERGETDASSPYGLFRQEVLEAEAEAHVRAVNRILKASKVDAKHAQWWLARKFPDQWADRSRVQVEGVKGGAPIPVEVRLVDVLSGPEEPKDEEDEEGP